MVLLVIKTYCAFTLAAFFRIMVLALASRDLGVSYPLPDPLALAVISLICRMPDARRLFFRNRTLRQSYLSFRLGGFSFKISSRPQLYLILLTRSLSSAFRWVCPASR